MGVDEVSGLPVEQNLKAEDYPSTVLVLPISRPFLPGSTVGITVSSDLIVSWLDYQKNGGKYVGTFLRRDYKENPEGMEESEKEEKLNNADGERNKKEKANE